MPSSKRCEKASPPRGAEKGPPPPRPSADAARAPPCDALGVVRVGRFWFCSAAVHARQVKRLEEICHHYDDATLERVLVPVARQLYVTSLRLLDYTMTNWAKKTRIMAVVTTPGGDRQPLNLFSHYKDWLRFYRRRGFDPFRRRERIYFVAGDGEVLDTTVAQLNFFFWAETRGILQYVREHKSIIEADMMQTLTESKRRRELAAQAPAPVAKRRRVELSRAPAAKCIVYPMQQRVTFNFESPV